MNTAYINHIKNLYRYAKHVTSIVRDADNMSEAAIKIRKNVTVEQIEEMEKFIKDLEDHGIHLLIEKNIN